jgi:hypothetical protein
MQYGLALQFVPKALQTEAVCKAAVQQYGRALRYVPKALLTVEFCLAAVQVNGWVLQLAPADLQAEVERRLKEKEEALK